MTTPVTIVRVFKSRRSGKWYYVPMARNHEKGDRSQAYASKRNAIRGAGRWHPGMPVDVQA